MKECRRDPDTPNSIFRVEAMTFKDQRIGSKLDLNEKLAHIWPALIRVHILGKHIAQNE